MKLYTSPLSPYSARVRASLYYKGLQAEMIKPSSLGGMTSSAFREITPIGKIPVLVLDDGFTITESDSIVEFLEELHPHPALRPANPLLRARARMLSRIVELYVMGAIVGLQPMMPISLHQAPVARDEKRISIHVADSDEVARVYRFEVARGFRDDVAHLSDLISPGARRSGRLVLWHRSSRVVNLEWRLESVFSSAAVAVGMWATPWRCPSEAACPQRHGLRPFGWIAGFGASFRRRDRADGRCGRGDRGRRRRRWGRR